MQASGRYARAARAFTELVLEVFRLNGELLIAGDRLTADLGLTSARWQVLGAIALADTRQPVSHLARTMGLTRQAVQRTANELRTAGLVVFEANPHHQRAQLVVMTPRGQRVYDAALRRQIPWANTVVRGLPDKNVAAALDTLRELRQRLASVQPMGPQKIGSPSSKGGSHAHPKRNGSQGLASPANGAGHGRSRRSDQHVRPRPRGR